MNKPDPQERGSASDLPPPSDAEARRAAPAVVCYDVGALPAAHDPDWLACWRAGLTVVDRIRVPPREARCFRVPGGHGIRIISCEGPQVGDLNLWYAHDMREHFFSGKTRQLHASHLTTGNRLWSTLPHLRPLATIAHDSLAWYGVDKDGGRVHDVIGTRCDPYTQHRLRGTDYHHCCHSNLTRALAEELALSLADAEAHVHDVMNVFMCTGFTRDTGQYFMKASPVRPGDSIEFLAETDLLGALSACPGGDCGSTHSSDATRCHPLLVEILAPAKQTLDGWQESRRSDYVHPNR